MSDDFKPVEQWAQERGTEDWAFGAARAAFNWARGKELSSHDYDAAIEKAVGATSSDGNPFDVSVEAAPEGEEAVSSSNLPARKRRR